MAHRFGLALVADCTASVLGDAVELREVLVNMIYNAIDAMPSGGEIRMSSQETNGRVVSNNCRQRYRHDAGGQVAPVRSFLYHQGQGWHRHGHGGELRHHPQAQRLD